MTREKRTFQEQLSVFIFWNELARTCDRVAQLARLEAQRASRKRLSSEIAGSNSVRQVWNDSVASGLTPQALARALTEAARGSMDAYLRLTEELEERDPHYASVLGVRKRAVSAIVPVVTPASEDKRDVEIAEAVEEYIARHDGLADLIEDLLDGLGKGFSVVGIIWQTGKLWPPAEFVWKHPTWFQFDQMDRRTLKLIKQGNVDGAEILLEGHIQRLQKRVGDGGGRFDNCARFGAGYFTRYHWPTIIGSVGRHKYSRADRSLCLDKVLLAHAHLATDRLLLITELDSITAARPGTVSVLSTV